MRRGWIAAAGVAVGCGPWTRGADVCVPERRPAALPLRESSGVVASRRHPGLFWTLDDSGPSVLHAVDADGSLLATVSVPGGLGQDREALALGPCDAGNCLYVADVGDNTEVRAGLALYRLPEPLPTDGIADTPDVFRFSLPDGPRDVEAVFLLPGERIHLVSKGRSHPPTLYRHPGPLRPRMGFLQEIQRLGHGPRPLQDQVTGADATPDGGVVALRTYRYLAFHRVEGDTLVTDPHVVVDLRTLQEPQGEGVALGSDGLVVLTGEAGPLGTRGSIAVLRCDPTLVRPGGSGASHSR